MSMGEIGLPEALERAAAALPADAEAIRPANGDPLQLRELLDAAGAARVLTWLLQHELEAGAELAATWADEPTRGAEPLQRVDAAALPKPARKALRRALHQLRSQGVPLREESRGQRVATLPALDDAVDAALVTPLDAWGARAVYLATSHPSGGVRLFELVIDEQRGVLEFEVYSAGRSKVRKFLRDFERRERFAAVAAPSASVHALIARAIAQQPAGRPPPRGLSEWRSRISEPPSGTPTPGEIARAALEVPDGEIPQLLERAVALVSGKELGPWPPREEDTRAVAQRIGEIGSGVILVSGVQRREQVRRCLDEALDALYADPFAALTARRWEESAYVFWKGGRETDARACVAAAQVFRAGRPSENPVARAALELVLAPALERVRESAEDQPGESLVVGAP
ncbi:MAG TPA: hypothetical protein VIY27_11390 [Myxococcota bacterium]